MTEYNDLTHRDELNAVYQRLQELPVIIRGAAVDLVEDEKILRESKAGEATAEEDLSVEIALATATAYEEGAISGKNQAQRDNELEVYLAKNNRVTNAEMELARCRQRARLCEAEAENTKARHASYLHELRALQYAVQLQVAALQWEPARQFGVEETSDD